MTSKARAFESKSNFGIQGESAGEDSVGEETAGDESAGEDTCYKRFQPIPIPLDGREIPQMLTRGACDSSRCPHHSRFSSSAREEK
jgi:hypothetical protein